MNVLIEYLSRHLELTEEEAEAIRQNVPIKSFSKGEILLREGEISRECYFVLKGCIRQYYLQDGNEKTTAFFTEEQAATSFLSFSKQLPANHFFECIEDTTTAVGTLDLEMDMFKKYPRLEKLSILFMQEDLGKNQEWSASFVNSTPEERYLILLRNRPDLLQRVPQHQLASYIGVAPESLSRIRKRISLK